MACFLEERGVAVREGFEPSVGIILMYFILNECDEFWGGNGTGNGWLVSA
jgi:hypothetical protein